MTEHHVVFGEITRAGMSREELQSRRKAVADMAARLDVIKTSCDYCMHMKVTTCALFDEEPPRKFREGEGQCESWAYDAIPL